jgi:glucose/arabinose dehydrogenase
MQKSSHLIMLMLCLLMVLPTIAQDVQTITDEASGVTYRIETFLEANFPVGMVFLPDGRLLYNEKTTGRVRLVDADGTRQLEPVIELPTDALQERGMLGIAVDPDFENNRWVYVVHTRAGTARDFPANTLVRFRLNDEGLGEDLETLLSAPIETGFLLHNGGNVHFDDEGYLYVSFGDLGDASNSQNPDTLEGAVHRFVVTDDGLIPAEGNPYGDDNSTYALGFRNPFDFTFDPETGRVFVTEVGPNCDDEINMIIPRFNYGWREEYECVGDDLITDVELYAPPLLSFNPVTAPTGIAFYTGDLAPAWQGDLFYCNWNFGELWRVVLDESRSRVAETHLIDLGDADCKIDLVQDAEGAFYFGTVGEGGGAIMKLTPIQDE